MKTDWTEKDRILARIQARAEILTELGKAQLADRMRLQKIEIDEAKTDALFHDVPEFQNW